MLHILWMILKIILILLGIVLGLLVLALLLLLFCPVRYGAEASGSLEQWKKAQACVSISWLFRGIMLKIRLENGKPAHSIRIFGIPLEKLLQKKKQRKKKTGGGKTPSAASEKEEPSLGSPVSERENKETSERENKETNGSQEEAEAAPEQRFTGNAENCSQKESDSVHVEEKEQPIGPEEPDSPSPEKKKGPGGAFRSIRNKIAAFSDKLKKIPEAIRGFTSKIQGIYDKINYWKQFLSHPRVKAAFEFARERAVMLLKHLFPTRIEGHVTFGSEDPALTGTVLAILGVTIPFHKNCIEIHPVFEGENLLNGDIKLRGRVYGFVLVKAAVQIYFNKNIKYVINRWKHKEESL